MGKPQHVFLKYPELDPDNPLSNLPVGQRKDFLQEAYKKHSAELASIEDRDNKFIVLILALYGAGATAFSTIDLRQHCWMACFFTLMVFLTMWAGGHTVHEAHDLRKAVRDMLVRCELAMDFYKPDVFLKDERLYGNAERCFSEKGANRQTFAYLIVGVGGALLLVLIWHSYLCGPLPGLRPSGGLKPSSSVDSTGTAKAVRFPSPHTPS
jgi:hypothetical protein